MNHRIRTITNSLKRIHTIRTMSHSKPSASLAKIIKIEDLPSEEARWTKLSKITYVDPAGKERLWESASRPTRPEGSPVDAVAILAILQKEEPEIVLQKQFRPPIGGVSIEVPAGLVDPNEDIETTALRELHEETGYIGTVVSKSTIMYADPGFCNCNLCLVTVNIDLNDERNINPVAKLEDGEFIETFTVPLKDYEQELINLGNQGYKIDARVQNICEGIKLAQRFKI